MSIHNLSNDRGGLPLFNTRPSFLRGEDSPTLIRTIERYNAESSDGGNNGGGGQRLFGTGEGSDKIDYRSMAQAMLARLDALRDRFFGGENSSQNASQRSSVEGGAFDSQSNSSSVSHNGWWNNGKWYATNNAPTTPTTPPPPTNTAPTTPSPTTTPTATPTTSVPAPSAPTTTPTTSAPAPTVAPAPTAPTAPTNSTPTIISGLTQSGSISLHDGATNISDTSITGLHGIMGGNATNVSSLTLNNVRINSTNYGIYLGSADTVRLSNVEIETAANGGDSYSVRGSIRNFVSNDSTYRSGIKAFRIYGLESGSSTRDTFTGGRLLLGGSPATSTGAHQPFRNFTFTDSRIDVDSVEIYHETSNVTFDGVDWSGTGHITIFSGAHDIVIKNSDSAMPLIKFYDSSGNRYYPSAAELASRNIVLEN